MKTKVGHSTNKNSFEQGAETAKKACEGLTPKLGMLFTSVVNNQEETVKGVKSITDAPIIGCTSSGAIIVPEGVLTSGDTGFSGMMTFDAEDLSVGVACSKAGSDARAIGRKVAKAALKNAGKMKVPNYFYMVASPKEEEYYLKGIQDVIGRVKFFGGSAADDTVTGEWSIICEDKIINDGVAVAFFYTNDEMVTEYTGDYKETDHVGIITKVSEDRQLLEIDNVPALTKYMEWTGKSLDEVAGGNLLAATILNPLGVKSRHGSLLSVCHPMSATDKNVIMLGNKVAKNTAVILLEATVDELIKAVGSTINDVNKSMHDDASGYFLVHCGGRKLGIGDRVEEVHKQIVDKTGGKPFITIFTFGEYGYYDHSANTCGGLMLSFTGIGK